MISPTPIRVSYNLGGADRSLKGRIKALMDAENDMAPLEYQRALRESRQLADSLNAARAWLHLPVLLANEPPARYIRRPITPWITLFEDPDVAQEAKCLIFAFCGLGDRLMMGTAVFLQLIPNAAFDVVVMRDPDRTLYEHGSRNYAKSFHELARRLSGDTKVDRYRRICSYGTSMGGFVALRFGQLVGGRAISVGGRFPWVIRRLISHGRQAIQAFDLLCACRKTESDFICVYGDRSEEDVKSADQLSTMYPVMHWPISDTSEHNVIFEMWKRGNLRQFYRDVFATEPAAANSSPISASDRHRPGSSIPSEVMSAPGIPR